MITTRNTSIKLKKKLGLVSISNPLKKKELESFYELKYFKENKTNFKKKYSKLEIKEKTYNFELYYFFIKKFFLKKIDLLEVGCGEGFGARYLHNKVNYFGTELTDTPIKNHNKLILKKIKFFKGNFLQINAIKEKKFDAIILNGVLEHLTDLTKSINFLHSILKKNGLFLLTVPNDFNILQKYYLKKNDIRDDRAPWVSYEHNHYFNKDSLNRIMIKKFKKISMMGDFPIDLFLLNNETNYYENKLFGKYAQDIRQKFNLLFRYKKGNLKPYIEFCESLCKLGLGRMLIACFRKR